MFSYTWEELYGHNLTQLIPVLGSNRFDDRLRPYLARHQAPDGTCRLEGQTKNGQPLALELATS
jgi:hypothetical protein